MDSRRHGKNLCCVEAQSRANHTLGSEVKKTTLMDIILRRHFDQSNS